MDILNYGKVKMDIESSSCPIHNLHPEVEIVGDNIKIKTCCEAFQEQSMELLQELLATHAQQAIMDAFKKGLK